MNEINRKHLWQVIQQTGDELKGKLPDHPNHPKGRNPYAHIALRIKIHFNDSYKDLPDYLFEDILEFIECIKKQDSFD